MTQNLLGMTADLIPLRFVWFHCDFASFFPLFKSERLSFSFILSKSQAYKKTAKAWNIVEIIRQAVESYRLGIKSKFIKIWTLNFDTFHLRLSEVKRVSNGYSVTNFYYYWLSQVNQKTNNSESKSHNHFKTWGFELKHPVRLNEYETAPYFIGFS